jgi:biotin carboxyl carrier protein
MYKVSIKDREFDIVNGEELFVDGVKKDVKFTFSGKGSLQVVVNGQSHEADLVSLDKEARKVTLRIEGKKLTAQIKEPVDLLFEQLGMKQTLVKKVNDLKAPMPGLIVKLLVAVGDTVKQGEPLLILEAMKMENVFKAAADVTIKEIKVSEKQSVEKGQLLMLFA